MLIALKSIVKYLCLHVGRLRKAGYETKGCKVHISFDLSSTVELQDGDSYASAKAKLEQEVANTQRRNAWRENSMSEREKQSRDSMKVASKIYMSEKWGKDHKCQMQKRECMKPWPYCPSCPSHMEHCLNKDMDWSALVELSEKANMVFENDPNQPVKLEV